MSFRSLPIRKGAPLRQYSKPLIPFKNFLHDFRILEYSPPQDIHYIQETGV